MSNIIERSQNIQVASILMVFVKFINSRELLELHGTVMEQLLQYLSPK